MVLLSGLDVRGEVITCVNMVVRNIYTECIPALYKKEITLANISYY